MAQIRLDFASLAIVVSLQAQAKASSTYIGDLPEPKKTLFRRINSKILSYIKLYHEPERIITLFGQPFRLYNGLKARSLSLSLSHTHKHTRTCTLKYSPICFLANYQGWQLECTRIRWKIGQACWRTVRAFV